MKKKIITLLLILFFLIGCEEKESISEEPTYTKEFDNIKINIIYNKERYVLEGNIPKTVKITIKSKKDNFDDIETPEIKLDLSDYQESEFDIDLKCTNENEKYEYYIEPFTINLKLSEKKSIVKQIEKIIMNEKYLEVNEISLDHNEVIVKGSQETLDKISSIGAIIDLKQIKDGKLSNIELIAYDNNKDIMENVEIVPFTVDAIIS